MIPSSPNDNPKSAYERQLAILALLKRSGSVTVQELANNFACSLATIRRDLQDLVKHEPEIRRYHGAVGIEPHATEQWFNEKTSLFTDEKEELAQLVVDWLPDGSIVGLNGGTTTTQVAAAIGKNPKGMTVVTNAINIAYQLARADVAVVVIGGDLRPYNYETTGTMAIAGLSHLHLDWAILGANGVHPKVGITTTANEEALLGQSFRRSANKILIIADHSKIERNALYRMLSWTETDYVATGMDAFSTIRDWPLTSSPVFNERKTVGIWETKLGREQP
ncbi:MAG: DeoR/GlpR transcriptional regulator [Sulfobacillus benefaciens]|uniref:DeoR/GlpR transcriptional regulator n=1 Tax=Sulfobacillus benefaciens TaxID=453960 RepID=A0A2T2WL79_9FIRM|nr:MAG: DeoR/GlpR transcriptional regulator [Sulfobacillus benefaciens]